MKKLFFIAFLVVCSINSNGQDKKYVTFQAEIANRNGDYIYLNNGDKTLKKIQINKDGVFKDSLNVKEGFYQMFDGVEYASLYLKNGFDLKLKMDAKEFDESLVYSGKGSAENNYLAQSALLDEKFNYDNLLTASVADFNKLVGEKKKADFAALEAAKLDPNFVSLQKRNIEMSLKGLEKFYNETQATNKINNSISASFDYENHKGGKTKLEDFKGKYVYIDVWATWCGPCRAEIPFLKKVEEKYHGKNIEFVSISIDALKDHDKWKKFVTDKELGGVQLMADKEWNSDFVKSFGIQGIPRFILIDPNGKVVKADAARPSSPKLQEELDALLH
ncbi:TlpA disulfide reductase family protein [Flavobacterium sp. GT3R68]|uniref:TlpA family protein disulfide reductase n=1 Tax=Flavobacterium sp. GT3R68 TaxID=2594437 RepID=UPI000F8938C3|nr:TlpA disulfide reductase family protein [Flavobacterium sp. GT3R68]RTY89342.1 TlpA family protein disulfide reductase [Flavobacterium sp. GSN2]TRW93902.1 TlpA family protein disulfide reductase [Flavobacterium sp. GT3R68]